MLILLILFGDDESLLLETSGSLNRKWHDIKEQHIIADFFSLSGNDAVQSHSWEQKIENEEEVKHSFQLLVAGQKAGETACFMFHISAP